MVLAYRDLSGETNAPVAVRSSATAEDLPSASFAGQQDTYLNVVGEAALLEAVRACWASLWTERAVAYRARQNIDSAHISMAVVVQRMAPAQAAGVLFTVNPMTGNEQEIMINAAWGLGEALVAGRVTPDTIVVDKSSGNIKQFTIGDKALMTVCAATGTFDVALDAQKRSQPALTTAQATELARVGRDIETCMGGAQDVEWALAEDQLLILQARAVTTAALIVPERRVPGDDAWPTPDERPLQPFDLWTHADMGERWPEPVTPLTWSLVGATTNPNTRFTLRDIGAAQRDDIQWARRFYGRVYFNEGALAELFSGAGLPTSIADKALGSGVPDSLRRNEPLRPVRLIRQVPRFLRVIAQRRRNEAVYRALFPRIERWVGEFQDRDLSVASDRAVWQELDEVWWPRVMRAIDLHGDATSQAMSTLALLEWLVQRCGGTGEQTRELVGGVANMRAAEMAPALWLIAQQLRQAGLANVIVENDPRVALARLRAEPTAEPALQALGEFLREHGHRATIEGELLYPRWAEAPEQVIAALAGYLQGDGARDPRETEAESRQRRDQTAAALDARLGRMQRRVIDPLVTRTQELIRLRDNGQHFVVKLFLPVRRLCAELGARWAERGWLAQPDDVFFLHASEVAALAFAGDPAAASDLATGVAQRRTAYRHWFSVTPPEVVDRGGQPVTLDAQAGETASRLIGIPASSGRVRGTARIAHSPQEAARLQPGEILVARSTDPGWTPAFALASGLVLEVGGQLSHGAIVAREFGLPAVLNVRDALTRISTGQTITVDGTAGVVLIEDPAP